ncbi:MAG TPA: hypothetical protein VFC18_08075 [Burkholderiales bacterium]|nr:hypothetical protein [Burkholderiales bacterium]
MCFSSCRIRLIVGVLRKARGRAILIEITVGSALRRRVSGKGLSLSAGLQVGEDDRLLAQWNRGEGISRYFNDGLSSIGAVFDAGGTLEPLQR